MALISSEWFGWLAWERALASPFSFSAAGIGNKNAREFDVASKHTLHSISDQRSRPGTCQFHTFLRNRQCFYLALWAIWTVPFNDCTFQKASAAASFGSGVVLSVVWNIPREVRPASSGISRTTLWLWSLLIDGGSLCHWLVLEDHQTRGVIFTLFFPSGEPITCYLCITAASR